ncbi:MAG: type II secretion system secretin GspD [Myxococcales bacterium]|nr:type II secretion system secretin GspD [Myxococcales bacterium]MDH3485503.1 type II secretion system secretin GspD [Myxococcales bacterium]
MKLQKHFVCLVIGSLLLSAGHEAIAQEDEAKPKPPPVRLPTAPVPLGSAPKPEAEEAEGVDTVVQGTEDLELPQFETGVEFKAMSPRTKVTFNLEEAELSDLVRLISNMTGRRFILPSKLRTIKATVFAPTKVTVAEAYQAFLSVLEVNGYTVVPAGRYLKIEELGGIERNTIPLYTDGTLVPASDRYVTRMHHLENVSADDVTNLLVRFASREGSITSYGPTNMLIITDTGSQIRRMLRLIAAVDLPRSGTQTWIEPIHYANAGELAARLLEIFPADDAATTATGAKRTVQRAKDSKGAAPTAAQVIGAVSAESAIRNIIADERTNSLIIIATERAYLRILEMIRQLDVPLEGEGRIQVHYVQHGAAADIAGALTALVGAASPRPTPGGAAARAAQARQAAGQVATGSLFEGTVAVTAYEPANALVITSSLHDYTALKRVIERLDAPRKQVFIEAVVMELGVERTSELGFAFHGGAGNFPTDGSLSLFGFNAPSSIDITQNNLTGLALGVRGPTIENSQQLVGFSVPGFGVVVTALASTGDADVLSTPHIIAIDNTEAEISVGENIPLQTNGVAPGTFAGLGSLGALGTAAQGGQDLGALAGLTGGLGSVARQDVGTTIRVVPHINENNEVRLEIEEEISEQGATSGTLGVVSINRRTARTEVMVRDQQTIVIGGLMRDAIQNTEDKVPVLGDIPILGALFRKTNKQKKKTNLLLILTPYIIRDPGDLREIFERKMQERQQMIDRYFVFGEDKFTPHIDYSRTRGVVSEIINEIDTVEEEIRLALAAELEPPPDHVPRAPIGSYVPTEPQLEEETLVIGPNGEEAREDIERKATEPTEADLQEGAGAPPPPVVVPDEPEIAPDVEPEPEPESAPEEPDVIEPETDAESAATVEQPTEEEPPLSPTNEGVRED